MKAGTKLKQMLLADCLPRLPEMETLIDISTPGFLIYGDAIHWLSLYRELNPFQILLFDENDALVACGVTVPIAWSGDLCDLPSSIEEVIVNGLENLGNGTANTLVPIGAYVQPEHQGVGLSQKVIKAMKALAGKLAMERLVIPVRPIWKHRYPLQPISGYAAWTNKKGEVFDPWLRLHLRMGATVLKSVESTITVTGQIQDWENLLAMEFPESGSYVIPQGMYPLEVNHATRQAVYCDPNVWVEHPL